MMTPADVDRHVGALRKLELIDCEAAAAGAEQLRAEVMQAIAQANPADAIEMRDAVRMANAAYATIEENIGGGRRLPRD